MNIDKNEILKDYYNRINDKSSLVENINNEIKRINTNEQMEFDMSFDMDIVRNGVKVNKNDYYKDFSIKNNVKNNNFTPTRIVNREVDESFKREIKANPGQVDPNDFFNNSLNGFVDKIK